MVGEKLICLFAWFMLPTDVLLVVPAAVDAADLFGVILLRVPSTDLGLVRVTNPFFNQYFIKQQKYIYTLPSASVTRTTFLFCKTAD